VLYDDVVTARYRYTRAGVGIVNHNTVKFNRARVPGGWERGSHEDDTEGWFHRPWPWNHPSSPSGTGLHRSVGFVPRHDAHRRAVRCRLVASPPFSLKINIVLRSCTGRSYVAPTDWSTNRQTRMYRVFWFAWKNISRLLLYGWSKYIKVMKKKKEKKKIDGLIMRIKFNTLLQ